VPVLLRGQWTSTPEERRENLLNNWGPPVWTPAARSAGVGQATPYTRRHTYASVLIHAGRSPLTVAAALGHASAKTTWTHYVHCLTEVRLASATDPETAICEAREVVLTDAGFRRSCDVAASPRRGAGIRKLDR
jgi:hypothetical protein